MAPHRDFSGRSHSALKSIRTNVFSCSVSSETSGFVDKLFESLYTKSYLPSLEPTKETKPAGQEKEAVKEEVTSSSPSPCLSFSAQPAVRCEAEREGKSRFIVTNIYISVHLKENVRQPFRQKHLRIPF